MTVPDERHRWRASGYGPHVLGIFGIAFLVAFESFAVATVLPVVARELDGLALYAASFAAPAATRVAAMTVAAWWCDRHGHAPAMIAGLLVFALGLLLTGAAGSMAWFVAGRAVQGVGSGLVGVALYVLVGQAFPEVLRPRAFVVLTSAWVAPAVVGPLIAGGVAEHLGWRWVFLGVPVLSAGALVLLRPALRTSRGDAGALLERTRVVRSVVVAAGVFAATIGGQRDVAGWPLLVVGGIVSALIAVRPLLPAGTVRAASGLPAVIATRSLIAAAFVAAESFVPLALVHVRGFSPTMAGLFLTTTAVLWFVGASVSDRVGWLTMRRRVVAGSGSVVVAVVTALLIPAPGVPALLVAVGWAFGGLGMGVAMPTLSVLLLGHSATGEQGRNSAAMQTSDAVSEALLLAVCSGVFAWLLIVGEVVAFVVVFLLALAPALLAVLVSARVTEPSAGG